MKLKENDVVVVIDNICKHDYQIGDIVIIHLTEVDNCYGMEGANGYWWCNKEEVYKIGEL